ncbi:YbaY family lipoprotein [Pseudomonas sp. RIT-PI-AD]|uniref:YbaY family lipoprotein n=1 Tax=Pseudomonas sp. RIT-PI-AD TaxID=3035294 RepID=UPI0021D8525A|nr:YbaY family lipoprotein [Pseudomonas sp. RIT-PI-AD]
MPRRAPLFPMALLLSACAGCSHAPLSLKGEVFYHARDALPEDAVLSVKLVDLTRADAPPRELALQQGKIRSPVPVSFRLDYDPDDILPGHSYAVQARIQRNGRLLFINTVHHGVLLDGSDPQPLRVRIAAIH